MGQMVGQRYIRLKSPIELDEVIRDYQRKLRELNLSKFKTQQFMAQLNKNLILNRFKFEIKKGKRKNPLNRIKITLPI